MPWCPRRSGQPQYAKSRKSAISYHERLGLWSWVSLGRAMVLLCNTMNFDHIFKQFLYDWHWPQSSLKAAPKRGHWLSLKYFLNNLLVYTKISSRDFTQFLLEFLCFEVAVSSKDVHRGSHLKLRGQDNPKTQKCIQNMSKIAIAIYLSI